MQELMFVILSLSGIWYLLQLQRRGTSPQDHDGVQCGPSQRVWLEHNNHSKARMIREAKDGEGRGQGQEQS